MKPLTFAACLSVLLALPLLAADEQADPTAGPTDMPNPVPADAPEPASNDAAPDACDPGDFAEWLGKPGDEVEKMEFKVPVRVIPEGGRVTMDFRPERVNFKLDASGIVAEITCG